MGARIQFLQGFEVEFTHRATSVGCSVDRGIVKKDGNAVAGHMRIGFDGMGAVFEAATEGDERVLGGRACRTAMAEYGGSGEVEVRMHPVNISRRCELPGRHLEEEAVERGSQGPVGL